MIQDFMALTEWGDRFYCSHPKTWLVYIYLHLLHLTFAIIQSNCIDSKFFTDEEYRQSLKKFFLKVVRKALRQHILVITKVL